MQRKDNKGQDMICDELKLIRQKELEKDIQISKNYLDNWSNRIQIHIDFCKDCQPERLSEKTPKGDAIV